MISKMLRLFDRNNNRMLRKKLDAEYLSTEIDAVVRLAQARINLFRGLSELKAQLGIDNKSQQLNMLNEGISSYRDLSKPTRLVVRIW